MRYVKIRIYAHILFWTGVLVFYTFLFGNENKEYLNAFFFVIWLLPVTIGTTYFLNYFLIPRFLLTKKYLRFGLFLLYVVIISITLEMNVVMCNILINAYYFDRLTVHASFNSFYLIAGNYLVVFFAVAIKLVNLWYRMESKAFLLEKESMAVELKLKEAQLKLLKAQIHPHFLFNTLNNLYGLTLKKSEKSPEVVLRISSLLDYMIYRSALPRVLLTEEINYIRDYIALEELRYSRLKLQYTFPEEPDGYSIAPLILQPFVENAFKHGTSNDIASPWIDIKAELQGSNELFFSVNNSRSAYTPDDPAGYTEGIGLKNVKERLRILYPENHFLRISEEEKCFGISLKLKLDFMK